MTKKERNMLKIVEYIGDCGNDFPDRRTIALTVLGYECDTSLYRMFSPVELADIEAEGLRLRREKYAPHLARVDRALLKKAAEGDVQAAKLCYQKFEGWSERSRVDVGVTLHDVLNAFPEDVRGQIKETMAQITNEKTSQ